MRPIEQEAGGALDTLATRCGVQRRYTDGMGQPREAADEAVVAVLRALGVPLARPEDAGDALRRIETDAARRLVEPVVVWWMDTPPTFALGPAAGSARVEIELETEDGERSAWAVEPDDAARTVRLPEGLPPGFHRLWVSADGRTEEATLLAAPERCHADPAAAGDSTPSLLGVFLPLYALRGEGDLGVGRLTDLQRLADWAAESGADMAGTLPLLATFLDDPFDPSPYAPVSRCVFSELYLDLGHAAERFGLNALRDLVRSAEFAGKAAESRARPDVDYRTAWSLVRRGLEAAADEVFSSDQLRGQAEAFAAVDPLIASYASFRADCFAGDPARCERERRVYLTGQWLLAEQLRGVAASGPGGRRPLYLDLPVGAHGAGFDSWRYPGLHAGGVSLGAPPDALFRSGQSWGFPPAIPSAARRLGHALFREAVGRHLSLARALRIDHAAGLFRCYWVPDGFSAADGAYVHYPADEHLAVLSILSHRHRAVIIGENLGTIPPEVNEGLARRGVLRMEIGQFGLGDDAKPLPEPETETLAALNTHDMPTFAGFWTGNDIPLHARLGVIDPASVDHERWWRGELRRRVTTALHERGLLDDNDPDAADPAEVGIALMRALAAHGPRVLLVNLEDLWAETEPQNVPGIVEGFDAWRRKASRDLETIVNDPALAAVLRTLRDELAGNTPGGEAN